MRTPGSHNCEWNARKSTTPLGSGSADPNSEVRGNLSGIHSEHIFLRRDLVSARTELRSRGTHGSNALAESIRSSSPSSTSNTTRVEIHHSNTKQSCYRTVHGTPVLSKYATTNLQKYGGLLFNIFGQSLSHKSYLHSVYLIRLISIQLICTHFT